jgi:hypothetical protein
MPLSRHLVLLLLSWSPPAGVVEAVVNAPKAKSLLGPSCCRICQNQFNNELSFLEVDDGAKLTAIQSFDAWSREQTTSSSFLQMGSEVRPAFPFALLCLDDWGRAPAPCVLPHSPLLNARVSLTSLIAAAAGAVTDNKSAAAEMCC